MSDTTARPATTEYAAAIHEELVEHGTTAIPIAGILAFIQALLSMFTTICPTPTPTPKPAASALAIIQNPTRFQARRINWAALRQTGYDQAHADALVAAAQTRVPGEDGVSAMFAEAGKPV